MVLHDYEYHKPDGNYSTRRSSCQWVRRNQARTIGDTAVKGTPQQHNNTRHHNIEYVGGGGRTERRNACLSPTKLQRALEGRQVGRQAGRSLGLVGRAGIPSSPPTPPPPLPLPPPPYPLFPYLTSTPSLPFDPLPVGYPAILPSTLSSSSFILLLSFSFLFAFLFLHSSLHLAPLPPFPPPQPLLPPFLSTSTSSPPQTFLFHPPIHFPPITFSLPLHTTPSPHPPHPNLHFCIPHLLLPHPSQHPPFPSLYPLPQCCHKNSVFFSPTSLHCDPDIPNSHSLLCHPIFYLSVFHLIVSSIYLLA